MWLHCRAGVCFVLIVLLSAGNTLDAKNKKGCKGKETLNGLENQDLRDPDENGVYHTNSVDDITLLAKKSQVHEDHENSNECEDEEVESSGNGEKTESTEKDDKESTEKDNKESTGKLKTGITKTAKPEGKKDDEKAQRKADVPSDDSALSNEKVKIKNLQESIHENLVKLFHHLRHSNGISKIAEVNKEVAKEKQDIAEEEKQMADLHQDTADMLKGLDNTSNVNKALDNHNSKVAQKMMNNGSEMSSNNVNKTRSDYGQKNAANNVSSPIKIHSNTKDEEQGAMSGNTSDKIGNNVGSKLKAFLDAKRLSNGNLTALHKMVNSLLKNKTPPKMGTLNLAKQNHPNIFKVSKHDPYAEIAASPDHPKLPPHIKLPKGSPLIPVGLPSADDAAGGGDAAGDAASNDKPPVKDGEKDDKEGGPADGAGPMMFPQTPAGYDGMTEAPGQNDGTMAGMVNPDLTDQRAFDSMRAEAIQDQLQEQIQRQAMEGMGMGGRGMAGGMRGMGGVNGMEQMEGMRSMAGGMRGMGGMNGMEQMEGMRSMAGAGGMRGMAGLGGMEGGRGLGGMQVPGGMAGMGGMNGEEGMPEGAMGYGGRDFYPGQDEAFRRNPYEEQSPFAMGDYGERSPMLGSYGDEEAPSMADEDAVGRNTVPVGYRSDSRASRYSRFYNPGLVDDEEDEDDYEEDEPEVADPRDRAPEPERYYDDVDEPEVEDDYRGYNDRKTKIAKVNDSKTTLSHKNAKKT